MEVLKSGKNCYAHKCGCQTVFAYGTEDIVDTKTWRNETEYYVICPICGKKVNVYLRNRLEVMQEEGLV